MGRNETTSPTCMLNLFDFLIRLNLLSPFDRRRNFCSSNGCSKQTASKDEEYANQEKKKSGKNCYKKTDWYVTEFKNLYTCLMCLNK